MLNTQEMNALPRPNATRQRDWYIVEAMEGDASELMRYYFTLADEPQNNTSVRYGLIETELDAYRDLIRTYRQQKNSVMFLAKNGREVIGKITLTGSDNPFTSHHTELSINVHPDYRGAGVGGALIRRALDWAYYHGGIRRIELEVLTRNPDAARLYERYGFRKEGIREGAYYLFDEDTPIAADVILMGLWVR